MSAFLLDPRLAAAGVRHGFGVRGAEPPGPVERPRQVHGAAVCEVRRAGDAAGVEADAVVSRAPGLAVGVVTADCVPILIAGAGARAVAAVHAGWRGLAAGVVAAGVGALRGVGAAPAECAAAIGPHVGPCCYEVDEPVLRALRALRARFASGLPADAVRPGRPGHAWLDLGALVEAELHSAGVAAVSRAVASCTACEAGRFHSYRRDGPHAGRLVHFVAVAGTAPQAMRRS